MSNDPNYLFVSTTINWFKSHWHVSDNAKCGCYNPPQTCCCYYTCYLGCQYNYNCRWYYEYGTFLLTGGAAPAYAPSRLLATSHSVDILSRQRGVETELSITISNMQTNVGPTYGSFILFHSDNNPTHANNNPFPATRYTDIAAYIDCKCVVGSSISITASTTYQEPACVRYIMPGYEPAFSVYLDVTTGQNVQCYFPGYVVSTATNPDHINIDMFLMFSNYFPRYMPRVPYWSAWARYNAEVSFTGTGLSGGLQSVS